MAGGMPHSVEGYLQLGRSDEEYSQELSKVLELFRNNQLTILGLVSCKVIRMHCSLYSLRLTPIFVREPSTKHSCPFIGYLVLPFPFTAKGLDYALSRASKESHLHLQTTAVHHVDVAARRKRGIGGIILGPNSHLNLCAAVGYWHWGAANERS